MGAVLTVDVRLPCALSASAPEALRTCEDGRWAVRSIVADERCVSLSEFPGVELSSPESSNWPGITRVACAILKSSLRVEW